jgi:hypothetical protein
MLKHHPLTPELALELFMSIGVGVFWFSAALVQWTWRELMELQTIWVQAYKYATMMEAAVLHSLGYLHFPGKSTSGGLGYPVQITILTQELGAEGGSGLGVGGHGPRTVTFSVAPRVTLYADSDS